MHTGTMVMIHRYEHDWNNGAIGWVESVDRTHFRLASTGGNNIAVGYEVKSIETVFDIESEGPWLWAAETLAAIGNDWYESTELTDGIRKSLVVDSLEDGQNFGYMTKVKGADNDSLCGYVVELDSAVMKLRSVDSVGVYDGTHLIDLGAIHEVEINTPELQDRAYLHKQWAKVGK